MKRIFILIVSALFLTSCNSSTSQFEVEVSFDSDQNFTTPSLNHGASSEDVLFFTVESEMLYCADLVNDICVPLCSKPECSHNGATCNAYCSIIHSLSLYDGGLFCFRSCGDGTFEIVDIFVDGTGRKKIKTFENDLITDFMSGVGDFSALSHRGYYIMSGTHHEVELGAAKDISKVIMCDLESQNDGKIIYENSVLTKVTVQAYEDFLYILAYSTEEIEICRYDLSTQESEVVCHVSIPIFSPLMWVDNEKILIADRSEKADVYIFDLDTNEFTLLYNFNEGSDISYYLYGFSNGNIIGGYPEGNKFKLCVKDERGNITLKTDMSINGIDESAPMYSFILGSDNENIYIESKVWSNENPAEYIFAVSLDDGSVKTLWSAEY